MKIPLSVAAALMLGGFAFGATGCVTEYQTVSTVPIYSGTTLPAASRVAVLMEFRGGSPSPQERADVRELIADYLAGKGAVLVEEPSAADYLVHVVLERRNPANPEEWTVVDTYSAHSLSSVAGDDYEWPAGIVEDDSYKVTTYSYIGFGAFYPIWFDAWSSPWHRGHIRICPPPRHHDHYRDNRWREERRHHRPDRWQKDRHPDLGRGDGRRMERDHREEQRRPDPVRSPQKRDTHRDRDRQDHGTVPPQPGRPHSGDHSRETVGSPSSAQSNLWTPPPPRNQPSVHHPGRQDRTGSDHGQPGRVAAPPKQAFQVQPSMPPPARSGDGMQPPRHRAPEARPGPPHIEPGKGRMARPNGDESRRVPPPNHTEVRQPSPRDHHQPHPPKSDRREDKDDEKRDRH